MCRILLGAKVEADSTERGRSVVSSGSRRVCGLTINWNRWPDTIGCLESLVAQTVRLTEIIVVDNGSTDDSVKQIRQRFPTVIIVESGRNLGFAAGCNLGLTRALDQGSDYIFVVNNDATLAADALACLLRAADEDVGILSPKVFYASHPTRINTIGGRRHWLTLEKTGDACGREDDPLRYGTRECDYLAGCGMLLSRRLLCEVGLFDTRFFMYYEDSDLSWRARQAGFKLLLVADAHMWHKAGMSSGGEDSPGRRYAMAKSSVIFFRKYVRGWRWLIVGPYRFGSAVKTTFRLLIHRRFAAVQAYWRGLRDGLLEK